MSQSADEALGEAVMVVIVAIIEVLKTAPHYLAVFLNWAKTLTQTDLLILVGMYLCVVFLYLTRNVPKSIWKQIVADPRKTLVAEIRQPGDLLPRLRHMAGIILRERVHLLDGVIPVPVVYKLQPRFILSLDCRTVYQNLTKVVMTLDNTRLHIAVNALPIELRTALASMMPETMLSNGDRSSLLLVQSQIARAVRAYIVNNPLTSHTLTTFYTTTMLAAVYSSPLTLLAQAHLYNFRANILNKSKFAKNGNTPFGDVGVVD